MPNMETYHQRHALILCMDVRRAVMDNEEQNLNLSRIRYIYSNEIKKTAYERHESISSLIYDS